MPKNVYSELLQYVCTAVVCTGTAQYLRWQIGSLPSQQLLAERCQAYQSTVITFLHYNETTTTNKKKNNTAHRCCAFHQSSTQPQQPFGTDSRAATTATVPISAAAQQVAPLSNNKGSPVANLRQLLSAQRSCPLHT